MGYVVIYYKNQPEKAAVITVNCIWIHTRDTCCSDKCWIISLLNMYLPNINLTKKSKTDEQTTTAVQHTEGKII